MARGVRRLASVCTGTFLLAEAGLLDGRRATTHWGACRELARRYHRVVVEADPIFVRDGRIYTSAGVTAGMDLALALVEEDHGHDVALAAARELVMFLKRPGGQSQFSAQLTAGALAGRSATSACWRGSASARRRWKRSPRSAPARCCWARPACSTGGERPRTGARSIGSGG
jgi:transcriptional regulator GlxA family with amidase domain